MDVVISFDDTGSMASVRAQVRQKIKSLVKELFVLDPDLRIGIIIHLDYCDKDILKYLDLTTDQAVIDAFINSRLDGYGGDADECYELAINHIHSKMSWKSGKKIAILIGDSEPHEVGYRVYSKCIGGEFKNMLDWQDELLICRDADIKVYPIQCLRTGKNYFYDAVAQATGTHKLELSQFAHITQFLTGILYSEQDKLDQYEDSQPEFKTNHSLKNMFSKLRDKVAPKAEYAKIDTSTLRGSGYRSSYSSYSSSSRSTSSSKRVSTVDPTKGADADATIDLASRFQVLDVGSDKIVIRDFVEKNGATFKVGRGFYEFIKPELIQKGKEVLFVNKLTGETKSDTIWCREQIGLPFGKEGKVNPKKLECYKEYDMYIQSTSYTRKLDPNTKFLYELEHK
jgi:hypothetical protein